MADRYGYGNHIVVSMERAGAALRQILDVVTNEVRMGVNAGVKQTAKETAKITRKRQKSPERAVGILTPVRTEAGSIESPSLTGSTPAG